MKLHIEIDVGNDAFGESMDEVESECRRIVDEGWEKLRRAGTAPLFDLNGNRVGFASFCDCALSAMPK